jgi:hypothetical protein
MPHFSHISPTLFPELHQLEQLIAKYDTHLRSDVLTTITVDGLNLPIWSIELGSQAADAPTIGFFGGVHGMERIGSQILLAWLENLLARCQWDEGLLHLLSKVRLVCIPLLNVGGLLKSTRSNPNGVDLMRNAPVEAQGFTAWPLGGQRLSPKLPWYRGQKNQLEIESQVLVRYVQEKLLGQPFSLAMDCHSGFGLRDRIWFPYASHRQAPPHLAEAVALREIFNNTYPNHSFYLMEPQSLNYTTHGDLWDYLYQVQLQSGNNHVFLPFTLEMGSWLWVKKNPRQLFTWFGHFNPILPHRLTRVLRRHLTLFDFLLSATASYQYWLPSEEQRDEYTQLGLQRWY